MNIGDRIPPHSLGVLSGGALQVLLGGRDVRHLDGAQARSSCP